MAKKIQISTIREVASIQVIRLDANFIAKAVKKQMQLQQEIDKLDAMINCGCVLSDNDLVDHHNRLLTIQEFFNELESAFNEDDESRPKTPNAKHLTLEEAQMKVNYLLETGKTPEEIAQMDAKGEDFGNLDVSEYLNHLETLQNCR